MRIRRSGLAAMLLASATAAQATNLDITTEYRMRSLAYTNLNLGPDKNDQSFLSQSARLGIAVNNVAIQDREESLDMVFRLRALGRTGRGQAAMPAPFDRIANQYPNASFTPFFENAFLRVKNLAGGPVELSIGRQSYTLGSGLVLDDNGAGLTGVSARGALPWWGMKLEGFAFHTDARNTGFGPVNMTAAGGALELPTEGSWQLYQMFEFDRTAQSLAVGGCPTAGGGGCAVPRADRYFTGLRYQISYGPLVFDGEAALQKGKAPTAAGNPLSSRITFNGNAFAVRTKWRQTFYRRKDGRSFQGIARLSLARGSGDDPSTPTVDEAFFPSHGLRYDGLERAGWGEFFGATPYDAFGGQSTATASGLPQGTSGIWVVGAGVTPPAYKGIALDIDYFLFQADRVAFGTNRTLGTELNFRLRYDLRERLQLRASAAFFTAGAAIAAGKPKARRYMFEAVGRF